MEYEIIVNNKKFSHWLWDVAGGVLDCQGKVLRGEGICCEPFIVEKGNTFTFEISSSTIASLKTIMAALPHQPVTLIFNTSNNEVYLSKVVV